MCKKELFNRLASLFNLPEKLPELLEPPEGQFSVDRWTLNGALLFSDKDLFQERSQTLNEQEREFELVDKKYYRIEFTHEGFKIRLSHIKGTIAMDLIVMEPKKRHLFTWKPHFEKSTEAYRRMDSIVVIDTKRSPFTLIDQATKVPLVTGNVKENTITLFPNTEDQVIIEYSDNINLEGDSNE